MKRIFVVCTLLGLTSLASADVILLQDLFDLPPLADSSQTKGGFGEVDNGTGGNGTAVESGGVVTLTDGSTPNIFGIVSSNQESFNSYPEITTTWMIEQYSFKNKVSYMAFTWQATDAYESTPGVVMIIDLDSGELRLEVNDESIGEVAIDTNFGESDSSFTLTATFTQARFTLVGAGENFRNQDGSALRLTADWVGSGGNVRDTLDGDMHVGSLLNAKGSQGLIADIDSVTVSIPEPAVISLISLFGGGMIFSRRIFGRKKSDSDA